MIHHLEENASYEQAENYTREYRERYTNLMRGTALTLRTVYEQAYREHGTPPPVQTHELSAEDMRACIMFVEFPDMARAQETIGRKVVETCRMLSVPAAEAATAMALGMRNLAVAAGKIARSHDA